MRSVEETAAGQPIEQHMRDVYGPAMPYDGLPEGTTVGTMFQFVGFSIGYNREHLLVPDEANRLADLLREAATKCRTITEAEKRERAARRQGRQEG